MGDHLGLLLRVRGQSRGCDRQPGCRARAATVGWLTRRRSRRAATTQPRELKPSHAARGSAAETLGISAVSYIPPVDQLASQLGAIFKYVPVRNAQELDRAC